MAYYRKEKHPWLLTFTMLALIGGILLLVIGIAGLFEGTTPDTFGGITLGGALLTAMAWYTLHATERFTRWDHGLSGGTRFIGSLTIFVGAYFALFLFLAIPVILRAMGESTRD